MVGHRTTHPERTWRRLDEELVTAVTDIWWPQDTDHPRLTESEHCDLVVVTLEEWDKCDEAGEDQVWFLL